MNTTVCRAVEVGSLPLISVAFTYVHIWMALWMTFYPLRYVGCLQIPGTNVGCGWQGVVPNKALKMARTAVRLMTERLFDIQEVFGRLDPAVIAVRLQPVVSALMRNIVEDTAQQHAPEIWKHLPVQVKEEIYAHAAQVTPGVVQGMFTDMRNNIKQCFDVEFMVIDALVKDKDLLNQIFIRCGYDELCFIRNAGAWMGGIFGIVQAIIYCFYDAHWVLPVAGLIVGSLTNWLALKMIFEPVDPIPLFGGRFVLQGLFLKRQKAVAAEYGRTLANEVVNAKNLMSAFICGPQAHVLFDLVYRRIRAACDEFGGNASLMVTLAIGESQYTRLKGQVCERFVEALPDCLRHIEPYADSVLDMEATLRDKLAELPSKDFENLLHPIFQEDEWKLVLMGGVLGVAIGLLQTYLINTGC